MIPYSLQHYLTENFITYLKIGILFLTIIFLFHQFISHKKTPAAISATKKALLALLAIISLVSYLNFGLLHRPNFIHWWEVFGYYMGAKYFKEVGYFDLYNAAVVADSEENSYLEKSNYIMDLRNYYLIPRDKILANAHLYKEKFSPERWQSFKNDIGFLKRQLWPRRFQRVLTDHGYHPSPVWNTTGEFLANNVPLKRVLFLCLIDPILLIAMFVVIYLSFGLIPCLLALIYFCLDFLSGFFWTSGAFLRQDWLAALILGFCMLKRNRYGLSGMFFSYSMMSRIFPLLFIGGLATKASLNLLIYKRIPRKYLNFFLVFLITTIILFAYGSWGGKGIQNWQDFWIKIKVHNDHLLTNNLGFRHIFLHDWRETNFPTFAANYGGYEYGGYPQDYFIIWTKVKQAEFREGMLSFTSYIALALLMFIYIARKEDDLKATAWGIIMIFMLLSISCYFYSFLMILVLMFAQNCHKNFNDTVNLALLFLMQIFFHLLSRNQFYLDRYYKISLIILSYFFFLVLYYLLQEIRNKRKTFLSDT